MNDPLAPLHDGLLPAAMRVTETRGRHFPEEEHDYRNPFQRDRDRIIHSAHFRRLEYKTQVFVNGEGDNYRTRLTHTLEVAQIVRTIARTLRLDEDLAEAVALSHDLGHTPFGHGGERELNRLLDAEGGFDHNAQGLRVVDILERRYAAFQGLNLTYEVREAFIRHGGRAVAEEHPEFPPDDQPLLEVEATMAADDIAYIAHDVDDGLYSGILSPEALARQPLWKRATNVPGFADFAPSLKRSEGVRRLINLLVTDLMRESRKNIERLEIDSVEKVRSTLTTLIRFSETIETEKQELKKFLFNNFYRHPNIVSAIGDAQKKLGWLFAHYAENPKKMPAEYQKIADIFGTRRAAADYVAGMTDRFANEDWMRHCGL